MTRRPHPGLRAAVTAVLAAALLPATAGCSVGFDAGTGVAYTPGDGVNADVGRMKVRGVTLVTAQPGGPASLVGAFVNDATRPDRLESVQLTGARSEATLSGGPLELPPGELVRVGEPGERLVTLEAPPSRLAAGNFVRVRFDFANAGSVAARVLVHAPVAEFATLAPTPVPSPTTPAATPTPTPGQTGGGDEAVESQQTAEPPENPSPSPVEPTGPTPSP